MPQHSHVQSHAAVPKNNLCDSRALLAARAIACGWTRPQAARCGRPLPSKEIDLPSCRDRVDRSRLRRTSRQNNHALGSVVKHTSVPSTEIANNALIAVQLITVCGRPGSCASSCESSAHGSADIQAQCSASGARDSCNHRPVRPSLPSLHWHARVARPMATWIRSCESVEFMVKCLAVVFIVISPKKVFKCVSAAASRPRVAASRAGRV